MKKAIKLTLYILTLIIQISIVCGVFIVQYLTKKKAGVMRHVYFRKHQFENSMFSQQNISMLKIASILVIVLFIIALIYVIKSKKSMFYRIQTLIAFVISMEVYIVISSTYFSEKLAYHYFIIAFVLVLIMQVLILISIALTAKK